MSCDRNGTKVSGWCAVRSGISRAGSQAANVNGGILTRLDRAGDTLGQTMSPAINGLTHICITPSPKIRAAARVVGAAGMGVAGKMARPEPPLWSPRTLVNVSLGRLAGESTNQAALRLALKLVPHGQAIRTGLMAADVVGGQAALRIARLSRSADAGEITQTRRRWLFFTRQERVKFWQSGLTPLLNRSDRLTRQVIDSQGLMLAVRGRGWHLGTSVVETGHGRQTITHLQSLGLVGLQHYYFNRRLTRAEAAGVASGNLTATDVPGYAGQVSHVESLLPALAQTKHALIKHRLHWPGHSGVTA